MAIYKISDIYNVLCDALCDGNEYANIYLTEADEEYPESITIEPLDELCNAAYEPIEACDIPSDYDFNNTHRQISASDYCDMLPFTYEEVLTIFDALNNAIEFCKECEKDPNNSREIRQNIKTFLVEFRNLQAKIRPIANLFK